MIGNCLVLEADGTEIDDDEILKYYAELSSIFIILNTNEHWQPNCTTIETDDTQNSITENANSQNLKYFTIVPQFENIQSPDNNSQLHQQESTSSNSEIVIQPETSLSASASSIVVDADAAVISPDVVDDIQIISSTKLTSYDKKLQFSNYKFDFKSIPSIINDELNAGKTLNISLKNDFIHHVVNALRKISLAIPMDIFRNVAKEITNKYPQGFSILDKNGKILDMDSITLSSSFLNHHQYLNRGLKRPLDTDELRPKHFKKINSLSSGVDNFFVDLPEDTTDLENRRLWLREHADVKILSADELKLEEEYFKTTFSLQRSFLNNFSSPPTITQIKSEWPHLLKNKYILYHFEKLFENVNTNQFPSEFDRLTCAIIQKVDKKFNEHDFTGSKPLKALQALGEKFDENIDNVLKKYPVSINYI